MKFRFCPDCGRELSRKQIGDEGLVPFCASCSRPWFGFSYPCVICLVVNELGEFALLRQNYISAEHFVLVSGYIQQGETAENAAAREVFEETGLTVTETRYILSRHYEKSDCLMLGFLCRVKKAEFHISGEVDEIGWFSLERAEELLREGSVGKELLLYYLRR